MDDNMKIWPPPKGILVVKVPKTPSSKIIGELKILIEKIPSKSKEINKIIKEVSQ